jgi:hypothetical protein
MDGCSASWLASKGRIMSMSISMLTKGTIKVQCSVLRAQLSVMPRSVLRSALGSLGSALAAACQLCSPCAACRLEGERTRGFWLFGGVCPCPLLLCLPDQRLLVLPLLLLQGHLIARRQRQLVVCAVEDTKAEGGPSEDLRTHC